MQIRKVGLIGVGAMGGPMAINLIRHGYEVAVATRTREKAEGVLALGAGWRENAAACAEGQDAVITMVGSPAEVEETYFGGRGVFAGARRGAFLIDMGTTSPALSRRIWERAKAAGMRALDAPVSGGDKGAREGTLSIMAGGEQEDFEACRPLFGALGSNVVYTGGPGSGQHTKMANQIAVAGALAGACEALIYAKGAGLDPQVLLSCLGAGAAGSWQLQNTAPKILRGDLEHGFLIRHYCKDLAIALEEAGQMGLTLPVVGEVDAMFEALRKDGFGELATQALIKRYTE